MDYIIIIFCLVIGFMSLFYGIKLFRTWLTIKSWTKVRAKVLNKTVADKKLTKATRRPKRVVVEYSYELNSKSYTNDKVFLAELLNGEKGFSQQSAEAFLKTVPDEIYIYADPKKPGQAVMFADGLALYILMIFLGCGVFCAGLLKMMLM